MPIQAASYSNKATIVRSCLGSLLCFAFAHSALGQTATATTANDYVIEGVILSARSGQPLSNASVSISGVDDRLPLAETLSDSQGRFAFTHVPNGKFSLRASHRGYIGAAYDEHETGTTAIVTGPNLISTGLQFRLQPQSTIYGTIAEDSGDPVPQARVTLYRLGGDGNQGGVTSRAQQTQSDDDGAFEVSGLAPGKYYLAVTGRPWYATEGQSIFNVSRSPEPSGHPHSPLDVAYPATFYPDVTDSAYAATIELVGGERVPINLTLHPVPSVHVTMQFQNTGSMPAPMPQIRQSIFGFPDVVQTNISLTTPDPDKNSNGVTSVELSGFAPGQYDLSVLHGGDEASRATQVNLSSDESLDLSGATPLASISGKVTRADTEVKQRQNPAGAQAGSQSGGENVGSTLFLMLTPQEGENRFSVPIGGKGSFRLPGVSPGTYEVSIHQGNDPLAISQLSATGAAVEGNRLKIGNDPVILSARVSESTATIHGFAKLAGKATAGVFLELVPMDANGPIVRSAALQTNQSDSDGSFDFPKVLPGTYALVAIQEGWTLDLDNRDAMRPYLAHGMKITVPAHSRDIVLKDAVDVQPK